MVVPPFVSQHMTLWAMSTIGLLVWAGAMAYLDTRHVQRLEYRQIINTHDENRLLDKIDRADNDILRLKLYNNLGSVTNAPAREQIILETERLKQRYERELNVVQQTRPKE